MSRGLRIRLWVVFVGCILIMANSLPLGVALGVGGGGAAGLGLGWRYDRGEGWLIAGVTDFEGDEMDRYGIGRTDEVWYFKNAIPSGGPRGPLHEHRMRRFLGFTVMADFPRAPEWYFVVGVPFWFLMLMSGWGLYRSSKRLWIGRSKGHREKCGYDLRATPDRCPECGTEVKAPAPPVLPP